MTFTNPPPSGQIVTADFTYYFCVRCGGTGRTPRTRRRREDGSHDPLDIVGQHMEICDRCGGSGEVPADPPPAFERRPGYVADLA